MRKKEWSNELKSKLDEFQVDIPDIPLKRRKLDRIANWIHAPAKNPLEVFRMKGDSIIKLAWYPVIFLFFISFVPIFFM